MTLPVKTLKDLGLLVQVVMAPTPIQLLPVVSYGSRARHTPLWHTTLTSLLIRDDFDTHPQVTPQHNANRPLLFIHVKLLTSTDKQPFWTCLSFLGYVVFLSRRPDRYNTNPTPTNRHAWFFTRQQLMTLNHSRHRRHCWQHFHKLTHWHADKFIFYSVKPWHSALEADVSDTRSSPNMCPPLVLPFHDSSLFLSICDICSLFFQSLDYCVTPSVWCRLALCL